MNGNISIDDLREGHKVTVSTWGSSYRHGTITAVEDDIKNGIPGIDYTDSNGGTWWCYIDQVVAYT